MEIMNGSGREGEIEGEAEVVQRRGQYKVCVNTVKKEGQHSCAEWCSPRTWMTSVYDE